MHALIQSMQDGWRRDAHRVLQTRSPSIFDVSVSVFAVCTDWRQIPAPRKVGDPLLRNRPPARFEEGSRARRRRGRCRCRRGGFYTDASRRSRPHRSPPAQPATDIQIYIIFYYCDSSTSRRRDTGPPSANLETWLFHQGEAAGAAFKNKVPTPKFIQKK